LAKMCLKMWLSFDPKCENLLIYMWNRYIVTTILYFVDQHIHIHIVDTKQELIRHAFQHYFVYLYLYSSYVLVDKNKKSVRTYHLLANNTSCNLYNFMFLFDRIFYRETTYHCVWCRRLRYGTVLLFTNE
jgi:hypothetical protein